jgi:hypothetical protein
MGSTGIGRQRGGGCGEQEARYVGPTLTPLSDLRLTITPSTPQRFISCLDLSKPTQIPSPVS